MLTLALSLFSYHFIENPIRRNVWLMAGTGRSLGFAALITTAGAAIAFASATLASDNLKIPATTHDRAKARSSRRPCAQSDPGCVLDLETVEPKSCVFGTPSANETVVLFGDSHADHWSTPLVEIARKDRFPPGDVHEIVLPGDAA